MPAKLLMTIIIVLVSIYFLSACRKTEVVQTKPVETPLTYFSPKINGFHSWSGTYVDDGTHYTKDTNFIFELKKISDTSFVAKLPNRAETLQYVWTNEIEKTILFNGSYDNSNYFYFYFYLTYYYADDHIVYEEYYSQNPYYHHLTNISHMVLHSP